MPLVLSNDCCCSYWPWTHNFKHLLLHLCSNSAIGRFYQIGVSEGDSVNWADSATQAQCRSLPLGLLYRLARRISAGKWSCMFLLVYWVNYYHIIPLRYKWSSTTPYSTLVVFMSTHISCPSVYVLDIKDIPILLVGSIINLGKVLSECWEVASICFFYKFSSKRSSFKLSKSWLNKNICKFFCVVSYYCWFVTFFSCFVFYILLPFL